MPRFLQLTTCYPAYLRHFTRRHPDAAALSHGQYLDALFADGFAGGHVIAPYLARLGYTTGYHITNNPVSQRAWCRDKGLDPPRFPEGEIDLAVRQVEDFAPDVLYLQYPVDDYDGAFLRRLSRRPRLVLAWRAAFIPPRTDWTGVDCLLSTWSEALDTARDRGAAEVAYALPGFPAAALDRIAGTPKRHDVVFAGSSLDLHGERNRLFLEISRAIMGPRGEFDLAYYMHHDSRAALPVGIAMHDRGPRWGGEMYRTLAAARIVVNASIDIATSQAPNMRLFEATGCGSFLLTARQRNLEAFFRPGREIETFGDGTELVDKIYYYLAHPREREEIAARGQARCLRDYNQELRARAFHRLIDRKLAPPVAAPMTLDQARQQRRQWREQGLLAADVARFPELARVRADFAERLVRCATSAFQAGAASQADAFLAILDADGLEARGARQLMAWRRLDAGDTDGALALAREETERYPENDEARYLLSSLLQGAPPPRPGKAILPPVGRPAAVEPNLRDEKRL